MCIPLYLLTGSQTDGRTFVAGDLKRCGKLQHARLRISARGAKLTAIVGTIIVIMLLLLLAQMRLWLLFFFRMALRFNAIIAQDLLHECISAVARTKNVLK